MPALSHDITATIPNQGPAGFFSRSLSWLSGTLWKNNIFLSGTGTIPHTVEKWGTKIGYQSGTVPVSKTVQNGTQK
jgi:hypothetical protein